MPKKKYWKGDYAILKGVEPSQISQLIRAKKLKLGKIHGRECVIDCEENDAYFQNPSVNSKRRIGNENEPTES